MKPIGLQKLLDHAFHTVPFYIGLKEKNNNKPLEFEKLPLIGKKYMMEHFEDFLSKTCSHYKRTDHPKPNDKQVLIYEYTSGSSGYPLKCYKTPGERTRLGISLYKKRKAVSPGFRNDRMFCFIHNTDFESHSYMDSPGNLSEDNIGRILTYLRDEVKPAYLHGNTMLFIYYADYIKKNNFQLGSWQIDFIESVSESITREQKQYIGEQFKTRIYNCYGCLECYNIAYECPAGELHINENVIIEIIDPNSGEIITPGTNDKEGEIVLTSLVNRAQPFIRYKTGDLGYIKTQTGCTCGNPMPVIRLSGKRKIDYIKLLFKSKEPKLNICGYDIFTTVMHRLITGGHDYVRWYNVIQTHLEGFDVLYTKNSRFSPVFFKLFRQYTEEELNMPVKINYIEKSEKEALLVNRKNRVFRSNLQSG